MMTEAAYQQYVDTVQSQDWVGVLGQEPGYPGYISFARDIRRSMAERLRDNELISCPQTIETVEDFFTRAKKTAKYHWAQAMVDHMWQDDEQTGSIRDAWLAYIDSYQLLDDTDKDAVEPLKEALQSRESFFYTLTHNGSNVLESVSMLDKDSWISCIAAYAEREMATSIVARHWIATMPESVYDRISSVMNRDELLLVTQLTSLTKYTDQAMLKVFDLMSNGVLNPTEFPGIDGIQYLFEVKQADNSIRLIPYADMFPHEWRQLTSRMNHYAGHIEELVKEKKIPTSYRDLADYLRQLSKGYASIETNPVIVEKMWKDIEESGVSLQKSECPIVVHPMGSPSITGEASKIDPEFSVSLHLPEARMLESHVSDYVEKAMILTDKLKQEGRISRPIPPVFMLYHVASGGSNIYWQIQGQSGEYDILCYVNRIQEEFYRDYVPVLERVIGYTLSGDEKEEFLRIFIIATAGHELGHALVNIEDSTIKPKIGTHASLYSFDEIKADSTWAWFVYKPDMSEYEARTSIQAYIAWCLHYIKTNLPYDGSSGQQYYALGFVELATIVKHGGISLLDESIDIQKPKEALYALSELSESLRSACMNSDLSSQKIRDIVAGMHSDARVFSQQIQHMVKASLH